MILSDEVRFELDGLLKRHPAIAPRLLEKIEAGGINGQLYLTDSINDPCGCLYHNAFVAEKGGVLPEVNNDVVHLFWPGESFWFDDDRIHEFTPLEKFVMDIAPGDTDQNSEVLALIADRIREFMSNT